MRFADKEVRMSQSADTMHQGDTLNISCAVNYSGFMAPSFEWYPLPDNILPLIDTGHSVNSTMQVISPSRLVQRYTCHVSFDGSIFPYAATQTSYQVTRKFISTLGERNVRI